MIFLFLSAIAALIGYRRWGGWRGAVKGVLILWVAYLILTVILAIWLFFAGGQVERILSEVGDSV